VIFCRAVRKIFKCSHVYHCDKRYPVLAVPKLYLVPGEEIQHNFQQDYWIEKITGQRALFYPEGPVVPQGNMAQEQAQHPQARQIFRERTENDPKPLFQREPKQQQSAPLQQNSPPVHQQQTPPHQQQSASLQQQSVPQQVLPAPSNLTNEPEQVYYPSPQSQGQPPVIIGPVTYYGQQQAGPGQQGLAPQQVLMPQMGQAYQQGQQGEIYYGQQQAGLGQQGPVPQQVFMPQMGQAYQQGQQGEIYYAQQQAGLGQQGPVPQQVFMPQMGQAYQQGQQGEIYYAQQQAGLGQQGPVPQQVFMPQMGQAYQQGQQGEIYYAQQQAGLGQQGPVPQQVVMPQMGQAYQQGQQGQIHLQYLMPQGAPIAQMGQAYHQQGQQGEIYYGQQQAGVSPSSGAVPLGEMPHWTPVPHMAYQQVQQEGLYLESSPVGATPSYPPGPGQQSLVAQQAPIPQTGQACQQGQMGLESLENELRAE